MELVYLWVEEYKNIKRQGFNFSSRFRCEYNYEINQLTIKEKTNEVNSLFGKRLNISAIVGENGSGKSTIIELVSFFRFERIQRLFKDKQIVLIYCINEKLFIPNSKTTAFSHQFEPTNIEIINHTSYEVNDELIHLEKDLFDITMFSSDLSNITDQSLNHESLKSDHYESFYNGYNVLYGKDIRDEKIIEKEFNAKYMYVHSKNQNFFDFLEEKFLFSNMVIELDLSKKSDFSFVSKEDKKYFEDIDSLFFESSGIDYFQEIEIYDSSEERYIDTFEPIQKEYLFYKLLAHSCIKEYYSLIKNFSRDFEDKFKLIFLDEVISDLNKEIEVFVKVSKDLTTFMEKKIAKIAIYNKILIILNMKIKLIDEFLLNKFESREKAGLLDEYKKYYRKKLKYFRRYKMYISILGKIFVSIDINNKEKLLSEIFEIDSSIIKKYYLYINRNKLMYENDSYGYLYINFTHKDNFTYSYRNLSTGEKSFLKFLVNFIYTVNNLAYSYNSLVFFDEVECSLHPKWQRKILFILQDIINNKLFVKSKTKWHFIFLTHSPFILSDIPKANVLFLKNGTEFDKEFEVETFGANIHSLLSHGFFMDEGLMGKFAKDKINSVYNFLIGEESTVKSKEEAKNIIGLIGEPLIKKQLEKLFNETFIENTLTVEEEILHLEEKLKNLKKIKNDSN